MPIICISRSEKEEGQSRLDPAHIHQEAVDSALGLEHGADDQQGDELGNGDGQREDGTPEALQSGAGTVDDHSHHSTGEEVQEGCEEGPDQSPGQNAAELLTDGIVGIKQCEEVLNTNPVKEHQPVPILRFSVSFPHSGHTFKCSSDIF